MHTLNSPVFSTGHLLIAIMAIASSTSPVVAEIVRCPSGQDRGEVLTVPLVDVGS